MRKSSLRRDPMRAVNRNAKTASHDNAVDQGNIWFTVGFDPAVHSIFIANEIEGKTFAELAAETGTSINTLLSRKRYAVLYLRRHLRNVYEEFNQGEMK